ncbi:hypothetical protein CYMTET_48936 [Cymbomonas tetramitiformis]|uniref:BTB domain-containing protein n=1 Tax=Cymbomonas tetramitiformis TaxID=36881 RepID=A0AAE0EUM4_9CHLO|nr:hypothetical protein CYMTET_48936 [Cymbomonas tetramitiformis]
MLGFDTDEEMDVSDGPTDEVLTDYDSNPCAEFADHPVHLAFEKYVLQIELGESHSSDTWRRAFGRLGTRRLLSPQMEQDTWTLYQPVPMMVAGLQGHEVIQVACGAEHNLAVTRGGEVWAWGCTMYGCLGTTPGPLPFNRDALLSSDYITLYSRPTPMVVPQLKGHEVVQVACGSYHNLAVTRRGKVWAWGSATHGKLGLTDHSGLPAHFMYKQDVYQLTPTVVAGLQGHDEVVQVACGERHNPAVTRGGKGKLGIGDMRWLPETPDTATEPPQIYSPMPLVVPRLLSVEYRTFFVAANTANNSTALLMPRYTTHTDTLTADASRAYGTLQQIMHDPTFADVEFVVASPSNGVKTTTAVQFLAHKAVLCACGEYFREFTGGLREAETAGHGERTRVDVTDIPPAAFRGILHWIYAGKLAASSDECTWESSLPAMLQAADKLQLQRLKIDVEGHFAENLTPKNAATMWQLARQYAAVALEASAFAYMVQHAMAVQGFDDFHTVCESEPELATKLLSTMLSPAES